MKTEVEVKGESENYHYSNTIEEAGYLNNTIQMSQLLN
jgi:hypothetical protein